MSPSSGNPPIQHSDAIKAILRRTIQTVRTDPDPVVAAHSLTRGTTIIGLMLEDLGDKRGGWTKFGGAVTRAGQILWSLVELAAPRSMGEVLFQHWIAIAYALAILMLITGVLTGAPAVTRAGGLVLGIALTVHVTVEQMRRWMLTGDLRKLRPILLVPVVILCTLAGVGLISRIWYLDNEIKQNGGAQNVSPITGIAGALTSPAEAENVLVTVENEHRMAESLEWDTVFIPVYFIWFLSIGAILSSHFLRPYRAFALVAIPAVITVVCDLAENLQAYLALTNHDKLTTWYTSQLKIEAGVVGLCVLAIEGLVLLLRRRQTV